MNSAVLRYLQVSKTSTEEEELLFDNKIWIPDQELGFRLVTILDDGLNDVLVGFRDEQGFFEKKRVNRKECELPSHNSANEDLCILTEPNVATVLDSLSRRYQHSVIHTYCGLFCVVINPWKNLPIYSKDVMDIYRSCVGDLKPHVYTVAQNAYDGILRGGRNQSVLITGESGAGKTENTKKIIDYILYCCGDAESTSTIDGHCIGSDIVNCGVLLESFGNARTNHNNNSSRFGKFIRIEFDDQGKLQSAQIECYLLEKSRVVNHNQGNRNFHIFYQLLSSAFGKEVKDSLKLSKSVDQYKFLNQGGVPVDKDIDDAEGGRTTDKAMTQLGISDSEKVAIFEIIAACILIGEIKFGERTGLDMSYVEGKSEVDAISHLFGLKSSRLVDALTQPTIRIGDKLIRKNQNMKKSSYSAAAMANVLYERLFSWVLDKCNTAISRRTALAKPCMTRFIGVLDIPGFEIMQKNSFEQFCINYTNEKLQQFFNHFMFIKEQAEYLEENIIWNQVDYAFDLQPTIDLIEKPLGLFALIEEECVVPNGSDMSLLEKYCTNLVQHSQFTRSKPSQRCQTVRHFSIKHYAGFVDYNIEQWVEKNRDAVEMSVLELLAESSHFLVQQLFPPVSSDTTRSRRTTMSQSTITFVYKNQLQALLDTLNMSSAHFIRCVVPNYERIPGKIDGPLILNQLKCNGVLEGIRICRQSFPSRFLFNEFIFRYKILGGNNFQGSGKSGAKQLCEIIEMDCSRYQFGNTKIFCKVGVISELEARRRDYISAIITKLQAYIKGFYMERDCCRKLRRKEAILTIQLNVRSFCEITDWPWFRLLSLIRPLIPKDRERAKIQELIEQNSELQKKNEETLIENLKLTTSCELLREKCAEVEQNADEERMIAAQSMAEKEKEIKKIRLEMQQNEDVFDVLEKKYNEQHQKVMKMNDALREYERKLDQTELERQDIEKELKRIRDSYEREKAHREHLEGEYEECTATIGELESRITKLLEDNGRLKLHLARAETNIEDEKARTKRQNDTIMELQKIISEFNERTTRFDANMLEEKNIRRKVERDRERVEDELKHSQEHNIKLQQKIDLLKEECRRKDSVISRLEKKLEDKETMMNDCVKELKDLHKAKVNELEEKMADYKRRNSKLESENNMQKIKLETTFERESSVDSDYGRSSSGRLSTLGRQYSLTSVSSFSSMRTLSRRRETEPDLSSSMYLTRRRDSQLDLTQSYSLQRTPSTSNLMEKEKKIAELERQMQNAHTELQLQKRELEVYRMNLNSLEKEKDTLLRQIRTFTVNNDNLTQQLDKAEKNADGLALRLKKAQADADLWKKKHEEAVIESQNEILLERKRTVERLEATKHEKNLRLSKLTSLEHANDDLRSELLKTQAELDRAIATIQGLESNVQSQVALGDSLETQYRNIIIELETVRDENSALKAKIRRQYKQIELLTQHDETNDVMNHLQNKIDRLEEWNQ